MIEGVILFSCLHSTRRSFYGWGYVRLADDRFWYIQADGPMETWLVAHSGGFDIKQPTPKVVFADPGPGRWQLCRLRLTA